MQQSSNHVYTVELRFSGDSLVPSEITQRLNLQPTNSSDGSQESPKGRKRRPFWAYSGQGESGFQSEWLSLEEGLKFVLVRVSSHRPKILEIAKQFNGVWWCGHFQKSFDGGPTLSPEVLAELASYGLPISIDNYFSNEEGSP